MSINKALIQIPSSFRALASARALHLAPAISSHRDYSSCFDNIHSRHLRLINIETLYGGTKFTTFNKNHSFRPRLNVPIRTNFSFAGPRKLDDIIKLDLVKDKSTAEISDMWMTYHEGKEKVHGLVLNGSKGKNVLSRAAQCPFFVHPVFREEGHFMIVSQFQTPHHFLLAFLEDYQMDPARAQPLLTISVFDDLVDSKDLALVRCDIINRGIEEDEGYKLCKYLIDDYSENEEFESVQTFNKKPESFDLDDFIKEKEKRWIEADDGTAGSNVIETTSEEKK